MHSQIKQIETIDKLPGYLFVLIRITNINEVVLLNCPKADYEFTNSMLRLIGLQAHPITKEITSEDKSLIIISSLDNINNMKLANTNYQCIIIYVDNKTINKYSNIKVEHFLMKHPHCIIILNLESSGIQKHFCICINQNNKYYEILQKCIL